MLTHGHHEVLRHFHGSLHFARDQRLRLGTTGWRVLDFNGNPLSEDELERQREKIRKGPFVVRDRELPLAEDLIIDEAGVVDPQLAVLTKVSCLVDALKMGGRYCRVCWKNVFVLTYGHHEVLRRFQGSRHFARDQRLRLETPGWRVLDFNGNPLSEDELERQREKIRTGPLVVRDREHPFAEDLITDEAGVVDPQLAVLTKVSCLMDALKLGGRYDVIGKLWAQFVLTVGPVNTELAWTRGEVSVGFVDFRNHFVSFLIDIVVLLLVNHRNWNATPKSVARSWLGEGSPFLQP